MVLAMSVRDGILLGGLVLHEDVTLSTLIGTLLVIGGIALVNSRFGTRPLFSRGTEALRRT